jgi:hypothetical protein
MKARQDSPDLAGMRSSLGRVWVVEIVLNDSIVAVGTSEAEALRNCAAKALEYLNNAGVGIDRHTGDPWDASTLVEYFGYRSTACELDGAGERH